MVSEPRESRKHSWDIMNSGSCKTYTCKNAYAQFLASELIYDLGFEGSQSADVCGHLTQQVYARPLYRY